MKNELNATISFLVYPGSISKIVENRSFEFLKANKIESADVKIVKVWQESNFFWPHPSLRWFCEISIKKIT